MDHDDQFEIDGLDSDVEIIIDTWGVPHIYASSLDDVYVGQGFNAARDRLFQIDLWRRRGHGQLSAVFGPNYLDQDRANRLFLYRGDMRAEWLAYSTTTKSILTAFTKGINAYITWAREQPDRLPPEFAVYGYLPSLWEPEDAIRFRTHGLFYSVEHELARAITLRDFGAEVEAVRATREPADPIVVPEGLDLSLFSTEILDVYRLAFAPVTFDGKTQPSDWEQAVSGSNNWLVDASRSTTGRPILANDPHRHVLLPSLRYMAHLVAPGLSVIGGGEPGLPGISFGHNEHLAFGATVWSSDQEDLYVYVLNPDDSSKYRYRDGWESFVTVTETLEVAGGAPVEISLSFTRHGPVVWTDVDKGAAVAIRAAWLQPGMAPYLGSVEAQGSRTADEFIEALNRWGAPGLNLIYASPDGQMGWKPSALMPHRRGWDGSMPVPGDGRYEWDGFIEPDELPSVRNPESGWFASANQMNLPADFDNRATTVAYDWYPSARYERIVEWLAAHDKTGIQDNWQMQWDSVSIFARTILAALAWVPTADIRDADVWSQLVTWDADETVDSVEATIFEIWVRRHLRPWLIDTFLARIGVDDARRPAARKLLNRDDTFRSDLRGEQRMIAQFDLGSAADRSLLASGIDSSLRAALEEIEGLLGADRSTWRWGSLHHARMINLPMVGVSGVPDSWKTLGPAERAGSGDTVAMAGYDAAFRQTIGSSFRVVIDVGEWDNSIAMTSPGQSGDPRSKHFADLFFPWAKGESFPLAFSRAAVESHRDFTITLHPPRSAPGAPAHHENERH